MKARPAEIRQLQAFSILAQELHFGRAAMRMGVTQPALSQLLRELEDRVGIALIERTTRRVALTAAGVTFVEDTRAILDKLELAVRRARDVAGYEAETLRIGAGLPAAFSFLPALLKLHRRRYPNIHVEVEIHESSELVRALERQQLDVGLLRPPEQTGALQMKTLYSETFLVAMTQDDPLARKQAVAIADLVRSRFFRIFRPDLKGAFSSVDQEIAAAGVQFNRHAKVQSTFQALALLAANGGVSLVPEWVSSIRWPGIAFKPVIGLTTPIEMSVAWRADHSTGMVLNFVELSQRVASSGGGVQGGTSEGRAVPR